MYRVHVRYWNKKTALWCEYHVVCKKGGLIIQSDTFGYRQYKGGNIRDLIENYRRHRIGYWWSIRSLDECQNMPKQN